MMKINQLFLQCAASKTAWLIILLLICVGGCQNQQEKMGVSPIPQNRPAEWELRPYGNVRS